MSKMNRRQLFLSTAKAAIAAALGGSWLSGKAKAQTGDSATAASAVPVNDQQITGTPGSPSATTTIDGRQLPPPDSKFGGVIKENAVESKPWWAPRVVPPKGAPNVLLIMTDDVGFGAPGSLQ
jgi:hypothetical protein